MTVNQRMKVLLMATNSILRTVNIKDKALAKSFIKALENAESIKSKDVTYSKSIKHLDKTSLEKIFKNK